MRLLISILILHLSCSAQQILVLPYIQPGNAPSLDYEEKVIIWQTDSIAAAFTVEYGKKRGEYAMAEVRSIPLHLGSRQFILYRAVLPKLEFDETYQYRVSMMGNPVVETEFETRSTKPASRFVIFGDCGAGTPGEAEVAYQVSLKKPEFILITGDNVYSRGRVNEYLQRYFPYYNGPAPLSHSGGGDAAPDRGAPLMRS